jgi:hypothetical protein
MDEQNNENRTTKHLLRDLVILLIPFILIYLIYVFFLK